MRSKQSGAWGLFCWTNPDVFPTIAIMLCVWEEWWQLCARELPSLLSQDHKYFSVALPCSLPRRFSRKFIIVGAVDSSTQWHFSHLTWLTVVSRTNWVITLNFAVRPVWFDPKWKIQAQLFHFLLFKVPHLQACCNRLSPGCCSNQLRYWIITVHNSVADTNATSDGEQLHFCCENELLRERDRWNHESSGWNYAALSFSWFSFFRWTKEFTNGMMIPWLVRRTRETLSCLVTRGFFNHSQTLKGLPLKPPLAAKRLRLRMEPSCMVMSSVGIIRGSQMQVLFRHHLLFASMLHPLLTFWRECVSIFCQILQTLISEDLAGLSSLTCACMSVWMLLLHMFACSCLLVWDFTLIPMTLTTKGCVKISQG